MNTLVKPHPPFTSAEFHKMALRGAFGDLRVELRRGMILKISPQHYPHARMKSDIQHALEAALAATGLGWEVLTETTVAFGGEFDPMPDIVVLDPGLMPVKTGPIPPAAVKLVVEIADSSLTDDMGEKREDYARRGAPEYWVADVNGKLVHMHAQPANGAFAVSRSAKVSEPLSMLTQPAVVAKL